MATCLVELELTQPLRDHGPFAEAPAVLALLRWRGRPVDLLRVPLRDGWVRAPQWQAALARWCQQPATRAALAEPRPLAGPVPALSIVITTHERPADLRRCLLALEPLTAQGCEVIVVDSDPTSNAAASVAASLAARGFALRYLCEPGPGLSQARNAGWRAARQALVAFLDDSTVVDAGWAAAMGCALNAPQVAGVAGLVLPLELETPEQELAEAWAAPRVFTRREFVAPGDARQPVLARVLEALPPARAAHIGQGANLAFRRDWLVRVGGFDPRLDQGGDTDLLARVLAAGGRLAYLPEASVRQRPPSDLAALRHAVFEQGAGPAAFAAKRLWENGDGRALLAAAHQFADRGRQAFLARPGQPALPLSLLALAAAGSLAGPLRFGQATLRRWQAQGLAYAGPQTSRKTS